jgi:hypothetical protein
MSVFVPPPLRQIALRSLTITIVRANIRWRRLTDVSYDFKRIVKAWQIPEAVKAKILDELEDSLREIRRWSMGLSFTYFLRRLSR